MKDIAKMTNQVVALQQKLENISPADPEFSVILKLMTEKMEEVDAERGRIEDLNAAKYLLNRHGYAFKIFGPEDVERHLMSMEDNDGGGREIAKIVDHVVNGDDWQTMSDVTDADEANIWALIEGTRGDHPEWFGEDR